MKITSLKLEILTVLATVAFLGISVPAFVADYFPLDVWEEMETWEQTTLAALDPDSTVYNEATPMGVDNAKMVNASFPFDVWKELDYLRVTDWSVLKNWKAFNLEYGTVKEDTTNPYWMPEEYRTP